MAQSISGRFNAADQYAAGRAGCAGCAGLAGAAGAAEAAALVSAGILLGAAGAIEAVVTILALREQAIPPTAHLASGGIDPTCEGVDHVLSGRKNVSLKAALSNSFAFGGSNAVLAFRAAPISNQ